MVRTSGVHQNFDHVIQSFVCRYSGRCKDEAGRADSIVGRVPETSVKIYEDFGQPGVRWGGSRKGCV